MSLPFAAPDRNGRRAAVPVVHSGVPPDERISRLRDHARRQHGVFTLAQAIVSGYSRPTIRRRLDSEDWQEIAPRVYRLAVSAEPDWRTRTMASALSVNGAACRTSALALHSLFRPPAAPEI